jgi:hypothetical protein
MTEKKKNKTPSRLKYEREHPTLSFRVSKELADRLRVVMEAEGMSTTDVLKRGLGLVEVKMRREEEIRREAYQAGWEQGYGDAYDEYMVEYPCSVCGKSIIADTKEEKEFIKRKMREEGWGHGDCIDGRR